MKLDPKVRRQVEKQLGMTLPDPRSETYTPFLASLRVSHPDLAKQLEGAVILESYGDPQSQAERRAVLAERLLSVKRTLIDRYDETNGDWLLSKRKLVLWALVPIALILGNVYLQSLSGNAAVRAQAAQVTETLSAELGFGSSFTGLAPLDLPIVPETTPEVVKVTTKQPVPVQTANPSPLKTAQTPPSQPAAPPALKPSGVFTREVAGETSVYARVTEPVEPEADPFSREVATSVKSLSVYTADVQVKTLSVQGQELAERGLSVYAGSADVSSDSSESQEAQSLSNENVNASASRAEGDLFAASSTSSSTSEAAAPMATQTVMSSESDTNVQPGTKTNATLEVGVIVIDAEATPVIAKGDDNSVWQGEATLSDTNRFTLEFSSVAKDGVTQAVTARAVAVDGFADLPATVKETTPALASDLVRGSLQGVSNYVDDLSNQTTTVVDEFGKTITQSAPSLENQILGSVAGMFKPTTEQALVRVAELPAGTTFTIVIF
ncbi:MAG: hypothetical protein ACRCYY_04680 [Trueperaceae bacterium]